MPEKTLNEWLRGRSAALRAKRFACLSALALAACATPAPRLLAPVNFGPLEIPIQGYHQRCVAVTEADRLDYDFLADPPLTFVIEYRSHDMAVQPLRREASAGEVGRFTADAARDYCLRWENESAFPALLRYRLAPVLQGASEQASPGRESLP